jgi:inosose dehydratase
VTDRSVTGLPVTGLPVTGLPVTDSPVTDSPVTDPPVTGSQLRVAGAPISWGVSEVPGWGYQLAPDRVLGEMRDLGLVATEYGPAGFLPADPGERAVTLGKYGLSALGGFVPVVLHDSAADPGAQIERALGDFAAAGADVLVLAAATGSDGYDVRPELDDHGWLTLLSSLDLAAARAAEIGLLVTLHPHVGTMIERRDEVHRVLDGCGIQLCLDSGHLLIGGTDPAELARQVPGRIAHAHLKDVDASWAEQVRDGAATYTEAVTAGMYRPLGQGDVDIAGLVGALRTGGYDGWYVLEQDTVLGGEPAGAGPARDVRASLAYLRDLP